MKVSKYLLTIDSPEDTIQVPQFIENVTAVRIRWLSYTTKTLSTSQRVLVLKTNLHDDGTILLPHGNNRSYLFSFPIGNQSDTINTYTNFFDDPDIVYSHPKSFSALEFAVHVDNYIFNEIDEQNPITMELYFYH